MDMDPRDHSWLTDDGDLIASGLTEYDALRIAKRCANKHRTRYIVQGPLFRTVVEPGPLPRHMRSLLRSLQLEKS